MTFQWTASQAQEYLISVGTTLGGRDIYTQSQGVNTSVTVSGLPIGSSTIYVRLSSLVGSLWSSYDYMYTAAAGASQTSSALPRIGSLAQVAAGGGWSTGITLNNLSPSVVNAIPPLLWQRRHAIVSAAEFSGLQHAECDKFFRRSDDCSESIDSHSSRILIIGHERWMGGCPGFRSIERICHLQRKLRIGLLLEWHRPAGHAVVAVDGLAL